MPEFNAPGVFRLSGYDVRSLGKAMLLYLDHAHSTLDENSQPRTPHLPPMPRMPEGVTCSNVPMAALLQDSPGSQDFTLIAPRDPQLEDPLRADRVVSTGEGVQQSVFHSAIQQMTSDSAYWQSVGSFKTPVFSSVANDERYARWKAYGALCTIFVCTYGQAPRPVSPFILLALISGDASLLSRLDVEWISMLDTELADDLHPWFNLQPGDLIPASNLTSPVSALLMSLSLMVRAHYSLKLSHILNLHSLLMYLVSGHLQSTLHGHLWS